MCARSCVATARRPDRAARTQVSTWHAEAPLLLKATRQKEPEPWPQLTEPARVSLTAGAAGPIGGDAYRLDVEVGAHSTLVLTDVSPTLLLPGPGSDPPPSSYTIRVDVRQHATLIWLAEPLIAANGCNHAHDIRVDLHPSARLVMREELLVGRHREGGGAVRQRISVHRAGQPLHRQDLSVGRGAIGYDGPAVLDSAQAVGSVLIVDPQWEDKPPREWVISPGAALLPLAGPAVLITAAAADNLALRTDLNSGLERLGPPWQPSWRTR